MIIGCLGWGSLIWDSRELPIRGRWFDDGPFVRVEFARQSNDGRVTLVIENTSPPVRALWAAMDSDCLDDAKRALQKREGTPKIENIGCWKAGDAPPGFITRLPDWANAHGIDAVIWTALPHKFGREIPAPPKVEDVLSYLRSLKGEKRHNAERYIRLAPKQIDTPYRRWIEAELGWMPLDKWPI